jgi:predicted enzyme related to lactoylglutathione lyase
MGNYKAFATGSAPCGGVMGACAQVPRPSWNYCIAVESVAAAADRAFARGGQILHGPVRSPRRLDRAVHRSPGRPLRDGNSGQVSNAGR